MTNPTPAFFEGILMHTQRESLKSAVSSARSLILEPDGSYTPVRPEYTRGIVELICDVFLIPGFVDEDEKRAEVYRLIGAAPSWRCAKCEGVDLPLHSRHCALRGAVSDD